MAAGLLRTALSGSVVLLFIPCRSRATSAAPNNVKQGDGWPIALFH